MAVTLFEVTDNDRALDVCPLYWQNYINSFHTSEDDDDLCTKRARRVKYNLKKHWGGKMLSNGYHFAVEFDTQEQCDWFLLRWL